MGATYNISFNNHIYMGVGTWLAKSEWLLTADRPQAKHHSP